MSPFDHEAYEAAITEVADTIGTEEVLLQLAEECSELSQACIKYHRTQRGLTPVGETKALDMIVEEVADVLLILDQVLYLADPAAPHSDRRRLADIDYYSRVMRTKAEKAQRWHDRMCLTEYPTAW